MTDGWARASLAGVVALALLCVLWEAVLAPLRPGSGWLAVKALPLVALLPAALKGGRKALQGLALLLPFYLAEGIVRGFSESGRHSVVAWAAAAIALVTFVAVLGWVRSERNAAPALRSR
jgi:uncharacterized membrane protein